MRLLSRIRLYTHSIASPRGPKDPLTLSDESETIKLEPIDTKISGIVNKLGTPGDQSCHHVETDHSCECSDLEGAKFADVLAQINFKQILRLATQLHHGEKPVTRSQALRSRLHIHSWCKVVAPALQGSYNILFPIRFRDGVQWLLKIPANGGTRWDEQSARALTSEVMTMKLIYNKSSIPVPRIYGYSSSRANPIGCPYIVMERIDGIPLSHGWYQHDAPAASLDRFRERALRDIAKAMVQLDTFSFPQAGALQYNAKSRTLGIGPYRKVDFLHEYELMKVGNIDVATHYVERGPFSDPKDYFLDTINNDTVTKLSPKLQGQRNLLRLFIDWFFEATQQQSSDFVLAHPDFNLQNVLVGQDGSLRGLVDWDGVAALPRCIGCEEYPLWLTRDWDPHWWNYDPIKGSVIDEDGDPVMTPHELDRFRNFYAQSIGAALNEQDPERPASGPRTFGPTTRLSALARCLYVAANEPLSMTYNVSMIMEKIMTITSDEDFGDDTMFSDSGYGEGEYSSSFYETEIELRSTSLTDKAGADVASLEEEDAEESLDCHPEENGEDVSLQDHFSTKTPLPWHYRFVTWTFLVLFYLLSLPASFLLFATWIQSLNIFPTVILFASLLTTNTHSLSRLAVIILAAQLYTRILASTFWDEPNRKSHHACQQEIGHPLSTSTQGTHTPTTEPGRLDHRENSTTTSLRSTSSSPPSPPNATSSEALPSTTQPQPHFNSSSTTPPPPSQPDDLNAIAQKWKEDPTHDFGTFTGRNIYNALYHGELDERRLYRLKIGFWRLLEQLDGCGEWDGGVGGRDEGA
ncbi:MAG: hypothetical protein Q9204_005689 [Flavoplaca sp. TL-2023a]